MESLSEFERKVIAKWESNGFSFPSPEQCEFYGLPEDKARSFVHYKDAPDPDVWWIIDISLDPDYHIFTAPVLLFPAVKGLRS
jgi:hypothetical protein